MDKGFHSPANQQALAALMPFPVLPKKGKCSAAQAVSAWAPSCGRRRRSGRAVTENGQPEGAAATTGQCAHGVVCPKSGEKARRSH
jgi:hypothetical protein